MAELHGFGLANTTILTCGLHLGAEFDVIPVVLAGIEPDRERLSLPEPFTQSTALPIYQG